MLVLCGLLPAVGCTVVSNFGEFKFGSDAGATAADGGYSNGCAASVESVCDDRKDDDCDQHVDCDDPDCANDTHCCKPNEIPEVSCSGGVDNDCDGMLDCDDPDCAASKACCSPSGPEVGPEACADGMDNDCDGVKDCDESVCATQANCCARQGQESGAAACSDGLDNDCDGKKDCRDPDCAGVSVCCTKLEDKELSCGDARDNDCDGVADCRDSDCEARPICQQCSPTAQTETSCDDLKDNDCDRDRDCWDEDCANALSCCVKTGPEQGDVACSDGVDDDCDGQLDCLDSDCAGSLACCVASGSESGDAACKDGKDNDCDGLVDCLDVDGCKTSASCCVPSGEESGAVRCNDGIDNDCNQRIDCADPNCDSSGTCCVRSGDESAAPNDGKDNDCNGLVDVATPSMLYPPPGQPSAGNEVSLSFMPEVVANATLECSTRRLAQLTAPVWSACPVDTTQPSVVKPHTDAAAQAVTNDGAWVTDVRWRFPNGAHSEVFSFRYYVHHSLYKAEHCPTLVSDERLFDFARARLADSKQFRPDDKSDTSVAGPFVHATFELPNANQITGLNYFQDGTKQTVDMWSLRKRFVLDAEAKLLLITRAYRATRAKTCKAAVISSHPTKNIRKLDYCDAVVLNRSGAGVCIQTTATGTLSFLRESLDTIADKIGWPKADKFMWRQLMEARARPGGYLGGKVRAPTNSYRWDEAMRYRNFLPKCTGTPCSSNGIVLPDRALFP